MKTFMALYLAPVTVLEQMMSKSTPEEREEGMAAWQAWNDAHEGDIVDMGKPLGKTKTVTGSGTKDTKNEICGYTFVQADSHEEAADIFEDHPHLTMMQGATIDVLECIEMDDMAAMK